MCSTKNIWSLRIGTLALVLCACFAAPAYSQPAKTPDADAHKKAEALIAQFKDKNANVRHTAVAELGKLGPGGHPRFDRRLKRQGRQAASFLSFYTGQTGACL